LGDLAMSIVNGFGLILAMYSVLIYHQHTVHRLSCQLYLIVALSGALFWLMAISAGWIKLDGVGFSAMMTSVCMFAAPLTAIYSIIKHHFMAENPGSPKRIFLNRKKTSIWVPREGITLGMILISSLVSFSWFVYGFLVHDKFVVIPNGLGLFMCLIQYAVWSFSYPSHTPDVSGVANSNSSSRAESRNTLLRFFKHSPETLNRDPLMSRPNTVAPIIEMKHF
jgi:hypothetical protein